MLDVAVSLAKVADVDRNIGDEKLATDGFQEAIDLLESLSLESEGSGLEQRVRFHNIVKKCYTHTHTIIMCLRFNNFLVMTCYLLFELYYV